MKWGLRKRQLKVAVGSVIPMARPRFPPFSRRMTLTLAIPIAANPSLLPLVSLQWRTFDTTPHRLKTVHLAFK
ncbi:unnamed protein product [Hydatigera taeniaeformis]|uniref:Uncharacterized protein n=1 Tax=Hydatigena taeniaeformis TaxID=6205 RepID=A0A0R3X898_HYDTA|nr:unnamed protein product [Hydatigera taeniaeformis]